MRIEQQGENCYFIEGYDDFDKYFCTYLYKEDVLDLQKQIYNILEDPRKTALKNGLRQLSIDELQEVLEYPGEMVLDHCNYKDGMFCPLAVAKDIHKTMQNPTDIEVTLELKSMGLKIYNTRGIKGSFYTENRREDLFIAIKEVIKEKQCL